MAVRRSTRRSPTLALVLNVALTLPLLFSVGQPLQHRNDASVVLAETWEGYKRDFILRDGRVRDYVRAWWVIEHERDQQTTSEGQAYAMLRAVWMDDRSEFDLVWRWTQSHLQVRHDRLFGWLWGPNVAGNRWTLLSRNSATDADEDIALALIFAGHRWHQTSYLNESHAVLRDIWNREVIQVQGNYYLTAGDWAASAGEPGPVVNPSYFAPYAYRIFAREDSSHPWQTLVASSYRALERCSQSTLNEGRSVGLPPNWCTLDRRDGSPHALGEVATKDDDYGYDAFRVMWRVALDYEWYRSSQAKSYLEESGYLRAQWRDSHWLGAEYSHAGRDPFLSYEDPTIYGGDIGNFVVVDSPAAQSILQQKLLPSLRRHDRVFYWGDRYNYFEQNWVWLGVALAAHALSNLDQRT